MERSIRMTRTSALKHPSWSGWGKRRVLFHIEATQSKNILIDAVLAPVQHLLRQARSPQEIADSKIERG
jgi:hypothetical protein